MPTSNSRNDIELALIREIDKAIVQFDMDLIENLVESVCGFVSSNFSSVQHSSFYTSGVDGYDLDFSHESAISVTRIQLNDDIVNELLRSGVFAGNSPFGGDEEIFLCAPICYPKDNIFALFVFIVEENSELNELIASVKRLATQIQIAFGAIHERNITRLTFDFWKHSSVEDASFDSSFNELAKTVQSFFPAFRSFSLVEEPEVTLTSFESGPQLGQPTNDLIIRGSSRGLHSNEVILRDQSISGLFLEVDEQVLVIDPRSDKYRGRYLQYLESSSGFPIQEIVFELKHDIVSHFQGVANIEFFEQQIPDAMINFLLGFLENISLLYALIESRVRSEMLSFKGDSVTMSEYLSQLSGLFKHEFGAHVSGVSAFLNAVEVKLGNNKPDVEDIKENIESIHDMISAQGEEIQYLIDNLSDLSDKREVCLRDFVNQVWRSFRITNRTELDQLEVLFDNKISEDIKVYTNGLLQVYLSNLFRNSLRSFQKKAPEKPEISVSCERQSIKNDKYEIWYDCLNFGDNGTGVPQNILQSLRQFKVGAHYGDYDGMGFALAGLRRLMHDLGGIVDLHSEEGVFFKVEIWFRRT